MSYGVQHSAYLTFPPLGQNYLHYAGSAHGIERYQTYFRRSGRTILQNYAVRKPSNGLIGYRAAHFRAISLRNVMAGVGHFEGKVPIVRQYEQAFRVDIQPAYRV